MPAQKRFKTKYPGVYYIHGKAVGTGKKERIYYIAYRKDGKLKDEKAGRQFQDDMTPARAAQVRTNRIQGKELSNKEINFYVENYHPFDKAGGYGIQEWIGFIGVTKIKGSYFNVMGLPVHKLYEELMKFQFDIV